ncbi:MAG: AMP-binding protein [Candidatus Aureabacteria bacterium]|nr:AMP-binding protein [Candidatus Auribacterota bacterium]
MKTYNGTNNNTNKLFPLKNKLLSSKTAFSCGDDSITYSELFKKVIDLNNQLDKKKDKDRSLILFKSKNSSFFLISFLESLYSERIFFPISHDMSKNGINRIKKDFSDAFFIKDTTRIKSSLFSYNFLEKTDNSTSIKAYHQIIDKHFLSKKNVLCLMTSGSTGTPKYIYRTAVSLKKQAECFSKRISLLPKDILFNPLPLYHSFAFDTCLIPCFLRGATYQSVPSISLQSIRGVLEKNKTTIFASTPYIFDLLCRSDISKKELKGIRLFLSAGAPLTKELFLKFKKRFGKNIVQLYGTSETGVISLNYPFNKNKFLSVGKPLNNLKIKIGKKDSAITVNKIKTSDTGYIDKNGILFLKGRKSDIINFAGKKIDPSEIEQILLQHPFIKEATVMGTPNKTYGEIVTAYIVPLRKIAEKSIIQFCAKNLPSYKIPKNIKFIKKTPKTGIGKIAKASLAEKSYKVQGTLR